MATPSDTPLRARLRRRLVAWRDRHLLRAAHYGSGGRPWPFLVDFLAALRAPPGPPVLLFGDSVHQRVADEDSDRRALPEMIAAALPENLAPRSLAVSAYTPLLFAPLLALAERLGARPKIVVIPVNLRCLSPQWDAGPIWQFAQDRAAIEAEIVDPARTPPPLEPVFFDTRIYCATAFASPLTAKSTIAEFWALKGGARADPVAERARLRDLLIFHYGAPVRAGHRQLAALAEAVRTARGLGAAVLVYATPQNHDLIADLGGPGLPAIVAANLTLVARAAEEPGAAFRDWSGLLPADAFFHPHEVTEHLAEAGRRKLAARIAAEIISLATSPKAG